MRGNLSLLTRTTARCSSAATCMVSDRVIGSTSGCGGYACNCKTSAGEIVRVRSGGVGLLIIICLILRMQTSTHQASRSCPGLLMIFCLTRRPAYRHGDPPSVVADPLPGAHAGFRSYVRTQPRCDGREAAYVVLEEVMRRAKLVGGSITRSKSRSRFFYNCCTKPREWTSPGPSLDHLYSTISDKCPAQHTGPIREKALKTSSLSPSADRLTMRRIRLCCPSSQLLPRHPSPTEGQRAGPIHGQRCRYGCGVGGWRPARGCGAMVADGRRDRSMWAWGWRNAIFGARRLSTPTKNPPRPPLARSAQTSTRQKTIRAPEHPRTPTRPQPPPLPPTSLTTSLIARFSHLASQTERNSTPPSRPPGCDRLVNSTRGSN